MEFLLFSLSGKTKRTGATKARTRRNPDDRRGISAGVLTYDRAAATPDRRTSVSGQGIAMAMIAPLRSLAVVCIGGRTYRFPRAASRTICVNEQLWVEETEGRYQEYKKGNISSRPAKDVFRNARGRIK
ncbi:MAG: hypothetical protein A2Z34_09990 [Planctomycetes bacterium RBG_16_59_8]|nr:MAG: hypothetical protein A2Z34_09990 [Planctomycetes bacterium RBG_16_59_8]